MDIDDYRALCELKARYFRLIDTKRWVELRDVFTDELVYEDDAKELTLNGADAFLAFLTERHAHSTSIHHGHMPELSLQDETHASGIWAMEDLVFLPNGTRTTTQHGYGHYLETYRKADGRWRIASIHLTRLRITVSEELIPGRQ